nr:retrotransposon protein, putative, Ty1-copia subclass [Tanacetum cinerariifolium]
KAALLDPESKKWLDAMNVEMQSMKDNNNMTSRFQQNSGEEHLTAVKNILKHLRNTKDMFLVYGGNMEPELRVSCYTDAGYLTDADNL